MSAPLENVNQIDINQNDFNTRNSQQNINQEETRNFHGRTVRQLNDIEDPDDSDADNQDRQVIIVHSERTLQKLRRIKCRMHAGFAVCCAGGASIITGLLIHQFKEEKKDMAQIFLFSGIGPFVLGAIGVLWNVDTYKHVRDGY